MGFDVVRDQSVNLGFVPSYLGSKKYNGEGHHLKLIVLLDCGTNIRKAAALAPV
jgi:hypothetical protein